MADTPRSVTALQALFADNFERDISEQDLRDFLVTALGVHGGLVANYAGNAVPIVANTYTRLEGVWTSSMPLKGGVTTNTVIGTVTVPLAGDYDCKMHMSGYVDDNNRILHTAIFVNGVESVLESNRKFSTGGDVGSQSFGGLLALNAGAVVDVRVNPNANTALFPEHSQFYCKLIG